MFVPGNRERFLEKVYELAPAPDAVFFDLEDGVIPPEKATARTMVARALREERPGPLRSVRINAVRTNWFRADMEAILGGGLEAVCVPKVESAADLEPVVALLDDADPAEAVRIVATIESAAGLLRAAEIAGAHQRILAVMFGAEDYALDLGLPAKREAEAADLVYARSATVVAATAARVLPIDGVFPDLDDREGLLREVVQARRLGFTAKATFNPRQVPVINEHFSPTADELEYARRVADAFAEASRRGDASVAVGGQLVDPPIVHRAEALLELAQRLGTGPVAKGT
ncbi:MAG: CoA ester lyase [Solirubrobacterales bacterium]|nr:CoA ester lyase [Solirubrobacterales bacterium]